MEGKHRDSDFPKVSIVVPSFNSSLLIAETLESFLLQDYPDIEVIVVDGGSLDRTLEIIKSLKDSRIRIYTTSEQARYAMVNIGITHAHGTYVNVMFPGDLYIHKHTLRDMMTLALDYNLPHLVYCGTLLRDNKAEAEVLFRTFSIPLLRLGRQPTSLQSCWFKAEVFRRIGKFNPRYELRSGFDFLCRFHLENTLSVHATHKTLVDFDLRFVSRGKILLHGYETMQIIAHHFGLWAVFVWLFTQNDPSFLLRMWWHSIRK